MRIVLIGRGVIGDGLRRFFGGRHDLIVASRSSPDQPVDIESREIGLPPLVRPVSLEAVMYAYGRSVPGVDSGRVIAAH